MGQSFTELNIVVPSTEIKFYRESHYSSDLEVLSKCKPKKGGEEENG
jgi:hypothetical protein